MDQETLSLKSSVERASEPLSAEVDGETIIFSLEQGNYYGLGELGSRIWSLIEKPVLVNDLVDELLQAFDVQREACCDDTLEFLEQLRTNRLINVIDP